MKGLFDMDKLKRIGAIVIVVILIALYITTLILSFMQSPEAKLFFRGCAIATVGLPVVALKANGEVWTWGHNGYGQLGVGNTERKIKPTKTNKKGVMITPFSLYLHLLYYFV